MTHHAEPEARGDLVGALGELATSCRQPGLEWTPMAHTRAKELSAEQRRSPGARSLAVDVYGDGTLVREVGLLRIEVAQERCRRESVELSLLREKQAREAIEASQRSSAKHPSASFTRVVTKVSATGKENTRLRALKDALEVELLGLRQTVQRLTSDRVRNERELAGERQARRSAEGRLLRLQEGLVKRDRSDDNGEETNTLVRSLQAAGATYRLGITTQRAAKKKEQRAKAARKAAEADKAAAVGESQAKVKKAHQAKKAAETKVTALQEELAACEADKTAAEQARAEVARLQKVLVAVQRLPVIQRLPAAGGPGDLGNLTLGI